MAEIQTVATDIGQVSINPQGEYSAGTQYHVLDVVTYNGSSYISVKDSLNKPVSNTTYWYLLASKGDTYEVTPEDLQAIADQITQDASSAFNQNVTAKTNAFNNNASQKVSDFNANATSKTTDFNSNATSKTTDFNSNATSKTNTFNTNATEKTTAFDGNYTDKVGLFNGNATDKTTAFNNNATDKTTDFNNNATAKTTAFDNNASAKTTDFNDNASAKVTYYNTNADSLIDKSNKVLDQIPTGTENNTVISVNDSSNLPFRDVKIKGNTSQATDVLTYTCIGTELGDYYFIYDNTNYQFTMPSISAGDVLAFNTTTLKLYQGDTEIATTTASTGTLITLNATPNPNYPQDIKVVTGDVEVDVIGKNFCKGFSTTKTVSDLTFEYKMDSSIVVNGTNNGSSMAYSLTSQNAGNYLFALPKGTYTISANATEDVRAQLVNANGSSIASLNSSTPETINVPNDLKVFYRAGVPVGSSVSNYTLQIQIEKGSTATPWTPFVSQSVTLNLGSIELAKIGDYQDVLFKNTKNSQYYNSSLTENAWYKLENVSKVTIDGTSGTYAQQPTDTSGYMRIVVSLSSINNIAIVSSSSVLSPTFCDKLKAGTITNSYSKKDSISLGNGLDYYKQFCFYIDEIAQMTLTNAKSWLGSNPLLVYYPHATPVYVPIVDTTLISQLESWLATSTYKNETSIFTVTDNEQPTLQVIYYKDLETLFNNLTNAIISLGNNT